MRRRKSQIYRLIYFFRDKVIALHSTALGAIADFFVNNQTLMLLIEIDLFLLIQQFVSLLKYAFSTQEPDIEQILQRKKGEGRKRCKGDWLCHCPLGNQAASLFQSHPTARGFPDAN
jgi:hypothetical protein